MTSREHLFPEMDQLTEEEIDQLLASDVSETSFQTFFESLETIKNATKIKEEIFNGNEELTSQLVDIAQNIQKLEDSIRETSIQIENKKLLKQEKTIQLDSILNETSTPALIHRLKEYSQTLETSSSQIISQLISKDSFATSNERGCSNFDETLKSLLQNRQQYHHSNLKIEALTRQLSSPNPTPTTSSSSSSRSSSFSSSSYPLPF